MLILRLYKKEITLTTKCCLKLGLMITLKQNKAIIYRDVCEYENYEFKKQTCCGQKKNN